MKRILFCLLLLVGLTGVTMAAAPDAPSPSREATQIRQDLDRILSDQRFDYPDYLAGIRDFFARIAKWFGQFNKPRYQIKTPWLDLFLKRLGLGLVVILPIGLLLISRHWIFREARLKNSVQKIVTPGLALQDNLVSSQAAAAQGEYRPAIRFLYLAALFNLRSSGCLPEGTRYSDKENLRTLRNKFGLSSQVYQAFDHLVILFQEKWYGLKNCNDADYYQAVQFYQTLATHLKDIH